jgi:hypothetical protein
MTLEPDRIPGSARSLLAVAERWAIEDDYEREAAVRRATRTEMEELVDAVDRVPDELWEWLAGPESFRPDPSPEYIAVTVITMAADSARLQLSRS